MPTPSTHNSSPAVPGPVPTALPELPSTDFWSKTQWDVFFALLDAAVPSVTTASALQSKTGQIVIREDDYGRALQDARRFVVDPPDEEQFLAFLQERPS